MSLKDYRRKRNFKKTSEPSKKGRQTNGVLHFVVQKHDASHLHYDFRLENRGVLKSWAVPKVIAQTPEIRRLAVEVEDHPLEYRHFHGTIPKGNYGAGTVEIWDQGRYYVDQTLDREGNERKISEGLNKGHLKFYLDGQRLQGLYALIKIRPSKGKNNQWLLIKKKEQGASDMEQLPVAPMPALVKPMLATLTTEPFDRPQWLFEVKWDGYRIIAEIKNHHVRLYTRNAKDYTDKFPQIAQALASLPDAVLDGEVVAVNEKGVSEFQRLQNYLRHQEGDLVYYVFDIVYFNQHDLHRLPLIQRKKILQQALMPSSLVRFSDYVQERGKDFFVAAQKNALEGIIAKNMQSPYQYASRSRDWLKVKAVKQQEAVIVGFTAPRGGRKFFGALVLGLYKNSKLVYVGHAGGGFDYELLKVIYVRLKSLISTHCPFETVPKTNAPVTWVKPQLLCEVKFQEWTNDGHMRQPIFLGMRDDK
ncbi:MAG: non-homologous end-joining DNA ligase, partial [Candidatus Omnitrophica bacterium]|nr:non-homologous end-joining DNA ligase [Candidatus Omnitrophota bacterium]